MTIPKIAVITVHGVADQKPGETAEALVNLLAGSAFEAAAGVDARRGTVRYEGRGCECFTLQVEPLKPAASQQDDGLATPFSEDRSAGKSFRQSWRSDLLEQAPSRPDGTAAAGTAEDAPDPGLQYTDFLLDKHFRNGGTHEPYASHVTRLQRSEGDRVTHEVDVFEMYWADLSRLSDKVPRIVGELFTLLFRFSRLGRDTVALARSLLGERSAAWRLTSFLQSALDWGLVHVVAMFTLLLLLTCVIVMAVGAAITDGDGYRAAVVPVLPWVYVVAGGLLLAYRAGGASRKAWREWIVPVVLLVAGLAFAALPQGALWAGIAGYFALVTVVLVAGLRVADDRFPFVKLSGLAFWSVGTAFMVLPALWACGPWARSCSPAWPLPLLLEGSLQVIDGVLVLGFKWPWMWVMPWLLLAWMLGGLIAGWRSGFSERATISTGRLGLVVSLAALLAIAMLLWAVAEKALPASVGWARFSPPFFPTEPDGSVYASEFLRERFAASTAGFVLIVVILGLLVLYLTLAFTPSILAEMLLLVDRKRETVRRQARARHTAAPPAQASLLERGRRARQLGKWLTRYYRYLDGVTVLITLLGLAAALLIAAAFAGSAAAGALYAALQRVSGSLLQPVALSATGFVTFLVAFGGLLSKYAPTLRGPLDIALDVDNHFREFPRAQIPRARIFSRYAALLRKIQQDGYHRIVIVAHSQGTVITTELLRYLSSPGELAAPGKPGSFDKPRLQDDDTDPPVYRPLPPIHLLTLGCPLRQLYAARFPVLYQWVHATDSTDPRVGVCGPRTHDIGVERWFNAFCSGDYVGRWLWSDHVPPGVGVPYSDTACAAAGIGRLDAYALMQLPPVAAAELAALARMQRVETCLGVGAHTHYFDPGQDVVAWLVDHLIG